MLSRRDLLAALAGLAVPDLGLAPPRRARPAPLAQPVVTFEGRNISSATYTSTGASDLGGSARHFAAVATPSRNLQVVFNNFYDAGNSERVNANQATIRISCALEYAGALHPVAFNGGNAVGVLAPDAMLVSDPVQLSVAAGTTIFTRTYAEIVESPQRVMPAGAFAQSQSVLPPDFPAKDAADSSRCGSNYAKYGGDGRNMVLEAGTGWIAATNVYAFGPTAIIGTPLATAKPVIAIVGDSEAAGVGDSPREQGWPVRAAKMSGQPYFQLARQSNAAYQYAGTGFTNRAKLAAAADYAFVMLGTNDLTYDRPYDAVVSSLTRVYRTLLDLGVRGVIGSTLLVNVKSSDGFRTAASQAPNLSERAEQARQRVNADLRAGKFPALMGVFDAAAIVEADAQNNLNPAGGHLYSGPADDTPFSTDGLHLAPIGHAREAAALAQLFTRLSK